MLEVDRSTLVIIPCCAAKVAGGTLDDAGPEPLQDLVTESAYVAMLDARGKVLRAVQHTPKFTEKKYAKNAAISNGPDFGRSVGASLTMSALDRYEGTLYQSPGLKAGIRKAVGSAEGPRILILSALYGPLHPLSRIQDYNLMMSDRPAKSWGTEFPKFLGDYVESNSIRQVALYVGTTTDYYKIACKAVLPMLVNGRVKSAVQYHVVGGNTRKTPKQHGALLRDQLAGTDCGHFFDHGLLEENALR